jgi:hypothetical protein
MRNFAAVAPFLWRGSAEYSTDQLSSAVIARERSDEAIQTKLLKAIVWIASLPIAMTAKRFR